MTGTALIAIGGNALVLDGEPGSIPRQQERAAVFAEQVAELVAADWTVVVSHGNGPQVGFILRRGELVASHASVEGLPELPLWLAVADSQGGIGHIIAMAIDMPCLGDVFPRALLCSSPMPRSIRTTPSSLLRRSRSAHE
jgi:carbamate kinase